MEITCEVARSADWQLIRNWRYYQCRRVTNLLPDCLPCASYDEKKTRSHPSQHHNFAPWDAPRANHEYQSNFSQFVTHAEIIKEWNMILTVCRKLIWPHSKGPFGPVVAPLASGCIRRTFLSWTTSDKGPLQASHAKVTLTAAARLMRIEDSILIDLMLDFLAQKYGWRDSSLFMWTAG